MYWSPRFKQMLGYTDHELAASLDGWLARVHPEDTDAVRAEFSFTDEHPGHLRIEYRMFDKSGKERWYLCRGAVVFDEQRTAIRAAGSQTDISARKQAEEAQSRTANHDTLTRLPNRTLFADRLEQAILLTRQSSRSFALLFVDIDHFRSINETWGRDAGDAVLVEMGHRLRAAVRDIDTVARLGSNEFAVLLMDLAHPTDATHFAMQLQQAIAHPFQLSESEIEVRASVGIKLSAADGQHLREFLRDADMALAEAKSAGPGRQHVFHPQLRRKGQECVRRAIVISDSTAS